MAKKCLTLVTGGTGFIGQKLVERLIEMGEPVRLLVRKSSNASPQLSERPKSAYRIAHSSEMFDLGSGLFGLL